MFSNFIVAVSAVVPIFVLIGIGLLVRRARLLTEEELAHTNRLVFRVFFFFTLFSNIYNADFADGSNRRGAMTQAIFRSNFIILGLPLVVNIFGEDGALVPTMMVAVIIPLYNIYAVLALETFRGGTFRLLPILRGVLKNPMIDGMLLGFLCRLLPFPLPDPLLRPLMQVGAATTPLALIILGASFRRGGISESRRDLWACVFIRLIAAPALVLTAAALLGFRGVEFVTLLAIFATPCAVASYAMAQQMGSDAALAGNTVVFTSALSCFTLFGWIFLTKTLGLF